MMTGCNPERTLKKKSYNKKLIKNIDENSPRKFHKPQAHFVSMITLFPVMPRRSLLLYDS